MTVVVQIGNSDDKLSQREWSEYVGDIQRVVGRWSEEIHFSGGSSFGAPWQNACWVLEVEDKRTVPLFAGIVKVRQEYGQETQKTHVIVSVVA